MDFGYWRDHSWHSVPFSTSLRARPGSHQVRRRVSCPRPVARRGTPQDIGRASSPRLRCSGLHRRRTGDTDSDYGRRAGSTVPGFLETPAVKDHGAWHAAQGPAGRIHICMGVPQRSQAGSQKMGRAATRLLLDGVFILDSGGTRTGGGGGNPPLALRGATRETAGPTERRQPSDSPISDIRALARGWQRQRLHSGRGAAVAYSSFRCLLFPI